MARDMDAAEKLVAQNRRARHDYFILETIEAGIVLSGTEVKSLRAGKASLGEAYATVEGGEAWVMPAAHPALRAGQPLESRPGAARASCCSTARRSTGWRRRWRRRARP